MKIAIAIVLLLVAILVGPVVWQFAHFDPKAVPSTGLPWQIEVLPGGETKVFDLTPGHSTLAEARARFGAEMQLAIVAEPNEAAALPAPIRAMAFIPSAQLDEAVILERFGQPSERSRVNDHVEHLLYPAKGLDVVLDTKGKELLQYVAPARFDALRAPLKAVEGAKP